MRWTRLVFISLLSFLFMTSSAFSRKAVANTSLAQAPPESVGTAECSGIYGGSPNSNPIQQATLESRTGGYTLKFTRVFQGQPEEIIWELGEDLIIETARTGERPEGRWNLTAYNRSDPVSIQSSGEFGINMMVSSRSVCTFSGTLEFLGDTQAQLFSEVSP
jgi:hypothetical protein